MNDRTERTRDARRSEPPRVQKLLFLVVAGHDLSSGGMRVALHDVDEVIIGRGLSRVLERPQPRLRRLSLADGRMSGSHAKVVRDGEAYAVEDLGSTNGTMRNGQPLSKRTPLGDGDILEIGQSVFVYRELVDEGRASDLASTDLANQRAGMITLDPSLARRFGRVDRVASSSLSVLLMGETGTGKEVLARAIHDASKRPGPFVAVNCGAIPANLVESHLFGHVKGAFSGAVRDEPGHVRSAHFGTLLLDEIGDLPASAQAALLRVLQEGEVVPVGSAQPVKVDVRVLGATHKSLEELVRRGTFRQDLYARLAGYVFVLPPLRERKVDLGLLIASLLARGKLERGSELRLHREAVRAMLRYEWPMNIRELEQCMRASAVLSEDGTITLDDLPKVIADGLEGGHGGAADEDGHDAGRDEELRRELLSRLSDCHGNVSEVARAMGKARQQVQRWLRRFDIDADSYKPK